MENHFPSVLPYTYWYYRRRRSRLDNLSLPQVFGTTVFTILSIPFLIVGICLALYFFLAYLAPSPLFWVALLSFSTWCLFQSK